MVRLKRESSLLGDHRLFFSVASSERQPDQIWSSHVALWNEVWSSGNIEVLGDVDLQRQVNGAFYYILSSLPPLSTLSEHKQFYGLSPGSLSRGGLLGEDYGGHSFWDTETWMYPAVLLFYPTYVRFSVVRLNMSDVVDWRKRSSPTALDLARQPCTTPVYLVTKDGGDHLRFISFCHAHLSFVSTCRFPWESARSGLDVTPDCCPEVRLYQMHITGDIAFAARQYIAATGDQKWLTAETGDDLIYETARFWASRAVYNSDRNQYEIHSNAS